MSIGTDLNDAYSVDKKYSSSFLQDNDDFDSEVTVKNSPFVESVETVNAFPVQHQDAPPSVTSMPAASHNYVENVKHPPSLAPVSDQKLDAVNPVQGQAPTTAFQYNYDSYREQMQNEANQHKAEEAKKLVDIKQMNTRKTKRNEYFINGGEREREKEKENDSRKKSDLYKSILFTLMILLAISTHYFVYFMYEQFLTASGKYSLKQEAGFRLIYPVAILAFIWYAKS